MRRPAFLRFIPALVLTACVALAQKPVLTDGQGIDGWPSFRGLQGSGVSTTAQLPVTWDVTSSTNVIWRSPLPGLGHSSPIVWATASTLRQRIYLTSEDGKVFVVRAGRTFELLAENDMNDVCMATPALSGNMLFLRTKTQLYALGA